MVPLCGTAVKTVKERGGEGREGEGKVKVRTLDIVPLRETLRQKHSGMTRVLKGFHSFTCTPTRSSAIGMSHTCRCLPSYSWYSFTDPGGMEGWVGLGGRLRRDSLPARRQSPIPLLTRLNVEQLRWSRPTLNRHVPLHLVYNLPTEGLRERTEYIDIFLVFSPSLNRVLFPMFCLLVEGECQILVLTYY